jgi:hypothetical protein
MLVVHLNSRNGITINGAVAVKLSALSSDGISLEVSSEIDESRTVEVAAYDSALQPCGVTIKVLKVEEDRVRVGLTCPDGVRIERIGESAGVPFPG